MWMEAYTTNSNPKVIGVGGCPQRLRANPDTENGHVRDMQMFLRRNHMDHHAGDGSFIFGCSTTNQRIESWWGILRRQSVQFWMDILQTLKWSLLRGLPGQIPGPVLFPQPHPGTVLNEVVLTYNVILKY